MNKLPFGEHQTANDVHTTPLAAHHLPFVADQLLNDVHQTTIVALTSPIAAHQTVVDAATAPLVNIEIQIFRMPCAKTGGSSTAYIP